MKTIKNKQFYFLIYFLVFFFFLSFSNLSLGMFSAEPKPNQQISVTIPNSSYYKFEVGLPLFASKNSFIFFTKDSDPILFLINTFIQWGIGLAGLILFISLVYAGIIYATSAGNPKKAQEAQQRIIEALIGFFLLFSFYVILNTINPNILKTKSAASPYIFTEVIPEDNSPVTTSSPATYVKIGPRTNYNLPLSNEFPDGAYINKDLAEKLDLLAKNFGTKGWQITEACKEIVEGKCKTTTTHLSACHDNGTCVDIGGKGLGNQNIQNDEVYRENFIKKANEVGLAVLDEYKCPQYGSGLHVGLADICQPNNSCWHCPTSR